MDEIERTSTASILVVDDDPGTRFLMRTALERVGFEVIEAADGVEGYQRYERHRPDLLLVDVMMPRMNGYELCRKLRSHAHSAYVPIVVVTSADDRYRLPAPMMPARPTSLQNRSIGPR